MMAGLVQLTPNGFYMAPLLIKLISEFEGKVWVFSRRLICFARRLCYLML
jgi:hypothetical protein